MVKLTRGIITLGLVLTLYNITHSETIDPTHNWPQWRGPLSTGVAPHADPPTEWSESKNIRWKLPLPGQGHSSPIVWGNLVFVTMAEPFGEILAPTYSDAPGAHSNHAVTQFHKFIILAINRQDGTIAWQKTLREAKPHEGGHYTASLASHSPVTDGEHLFAFFGSQGLYCLTLDGELVWEKDLGKMQTRHGHGEGSSPALHGNTLVINWDHQGDSFAIAFDKSTGTQRWRIERDEITSWATPITVDVGDQTQVIISGTNRVRGYNLETGHVIWECGGLSRNAIATPVYGNGIVYVASSYDTQALLAIRLEEAQGDITRTTQVAWTRGRGTPYVPSPLLYDDALYFLRHYQGILARVDAKTGKEHSGPLRLDGIRNVYASPAGAAGRVYITDRDGTTLVVSHDKSPQILAQNQLDDSFSASPAIVGPELYLRGEQNLYCIAED